LALALNTLTHPLRRIRYDEPVLFAAGIQAAIIGVLILPFHTALGLALVSAFAALSAAAGVEDRVRRVAHPRHAPRELLVAGSLILAAIALNVYALGRIEYVTSLGVAFDDPLVGSSAIVLFVSTALASYALADCISISAFKR
jgi:hypothetical protein